MHGIVLFVSLACSLMQLPLTVSQGGCNALSYICIYTWNQRQHIILETIVRVCLCVCVYLSCYMALFIFRFSFSTFAQFPVTILCICQIRATTDVFNYSLSNFLSVYLCLCVAFSVYHIQSFIHSFELIQWLTAEIKLAWQIKEFLHPLFCFLSFFLCCYCLLHCLKQPQ